jgi:hypothetical protein
MDRVEVVNKLTQLTIITSVMTIVGGLLCVAYLVFFARATSEKVNGGFWLLGVWGFFCASRFILPICGVDYATGIDVVAFNKTADAGAKMTVGYPNFFMGLSAVLFIFTVAGFFIKEAYQESGVSSVGTSYRQSPRQPKPLQELAPITSDSLPKGELEPVQTSSVGALKAIRKIQLD